MTAGYIESWYDVPDGMAVAEDTFNEVYRLFTQNGVRYIRQVGWLRGKAPIPENVRELDFEPNCMYDQPWYTLPDWSSEVCDWKSDTEMLNALVEPFVQAEWAKGRACAVGTTEEGVVISVSNGRKIKVLLDA